MKKLLTMIGVAIIAATTQAASMKWTLTTITDSADNAAKAGMVAYFMDATTYSAFSALDADKVAAYVTDKALYNGATVVTRTGDVQVSVTSGSYSANDAISGYVVLFDTSDASTASYYANTAVASTSISAAGSNATLAFGTFAAATSGWQTTAVPEPTSGLLMLLGMAGLALRRRRA